MKINEIITEAFDKPYAFNWSRGDHGDYDVFVKLPDGSPLNIAFNREGDDGWHVAFDRGHSQEITGEGDAQRIFATVLTSIQQFILKEEPDRLYFSASKDVEPGQNPTSRASLYERMVRRYAKSLGYDVVVDDRRGHTMFVLDKDPTVREEQIVETQFAVNRNPAKGLWQLRMPKAGAPLVDETEFVVLKDARPWQPPEGEEKLKITNFVVGDETDEKPQGEGRQIGYIRGGNDPFVYMDTMQPYRGSKYVVFNDRKFLAFDSLEENFADGKVKGKSRPGRVKRAGASCNGSVTDLRQRAKNASGEKAKMYHWCANMKSGRKK